MSFEKRRAELFMNSQLFPLDLLKSTSTTPKQAHSLKVGATFSSRKELAQQGVHTRVYAGISGSPKTGAVSIVLSGRYEDDTDKGDEIIYTGTGGQSDSFKNPGTQIEDQSFNHPMNRALQVSYETGHPVRVIRGSSSESKYAPTKGYRYDGLYKVTKAYEDKGQSGFLVCRFELRRLPDQLPIPTRR